MKDRNRLTLSLAFALLFALSAATLAHGNNDSVKGWCGGISVKGWVGKIDAKEASAGLTLNNAKLAKEGDALRVTTGPAVTYWDPKNTAKGDYTVSATFHEPKY